MTPYLQHTKEWVEQFVIGYNLCPFAARPHRLGRIRYVLVEGQHLNRLTDKLLYEARYLLAAEPQRTETTLLVHPHLLQDFDDYLDYLYAAEGLLQQWQMEGLLQLASFHPDYQFAGSSPEAASNYTNRSPYPMLHLLREDIVEQALLYYEHPEEIPERNIARMEEAGRDQLMAQLRQITDKK